VSATVFTRLTTHSRFAALLSADAGPARLPAAAEKLQLPLVSVLPLVEVDAGAEQVSPGYDLNFNLLPSLMMTYQRSLPTKYRPSVTCAEPPRSQATESVLRTPLTTATYDYNQAGSRRAPALTVDRSSTTNWCRINRKEAGCRESRLRGHVASSCSRWPAHNSST